MSILSSAWETFQGLPRAARWAAWGAAIVALAFLWNDHIRPLADRWNSSAEELLADLGRASGGELRLKNLEALRDVVRAVGPVKMPRKDADAEKAFNDVVSGVLKRHVVARDSFTSRGASKMPGGRLADVVAPDHEVQRITGDLRFDAAPEEAAAIISDLEESPEIEAISSVRITRQVNAKNKITVDLTVEAWIDSSGGAPRAGGPA